MGLNSVIKLSPPFFRRIGMSNENALWPARTVKIGFDVFEAAVVALSISAFCKGKVGPL